MFTLKVYPSEYDILKPNMVLALERQGWQDGKIGKVRILSLDRDHQCALLRYEGVAVPGLDSFEFGQTISASFTDLRWIMLEPQEVDKLPNGAPVIHFLNEKGERGMVHCTHGKRRFRPATLKVERVLRGHFYYGVGQEFPVDPLSIILIAD